MSKIAQSKNQIAAITMFVVFIAVSTVWLLQRSDAEVAPVSVPLTALTVPASVSAGSVVTVEGIGSEQHGLSVVTVSAGYGRLELEMLIDEGTGTLTLPAAVTQHAGVITVSSGDATAEVTVRPLDVHELIAPLVGPRTIVADGQDESLAVMLPVDRYGNQVADGTSVNVEWQQPGASETVNTETTDGIAWVPVESGLVSGATMVRATASSSTGEVVNAAAVRIDEVPGRVAGIELGASTTTGPADGRSVIEVETELLTDAFDNVLADGTVAQLVFDGPSGAGVTPGTVQNGVVRVDLVAPDLPGQLTASVHIHGEVSNEVTIDFVSAVESYEAWLDSVGTDVVLRIDRALDQSGAFIADGTEVRWGDERTQLRHGSAEIWIPADLVGEDISTVEILGLEQAPGGES